MNQIKHPDVYIILDVNWQEFEDRVMKRGREQEIENFELNKAYFQALISDYTHKIVSQCSVYGIPYKVIDTNQKTEEEVLAEALEIIQNLKS